MSARGDGGPAFPCEYVEHVSGAVGNNLPITSMSEGLTVRDYAAIHSDVPWAVVADQLYHSLGNKNPTFDQIAEGAAVLRYKMADAMISERVK